jgi:hypothetical protein
MGRLVGLVMAVLLVSLVAQAVIGEAPVWVSAVSIPAAAIGAGLAMGRVFGRAQRLGARTDPPTMRSALARSICRDHLVCLAAMASVLAVQIAGG